MKDDSIPICRSIFKHWIYEDAEYLKVWLTMLGKAQYTFEPKTKIWKGITYTQHRGEFIFGRKQWNIDTGVSEDRLRRIISLLIKDSMIELVVFKGKFSIYKIINYEKFNQHPDGKTKGSKTLPPPTEPQHSPNRPPTEPQQTTTIEEGIKKVKNDKNVYGTYQNVFLTVDEYERLKKEFIQADEAIEFLSAWIEEKGYKSKSHNLAIRRWVFDAVTKKNGGNNERILRSKHEHSPSAGSGGNEHSASKVPEGFWT